jgi:hypothetical protein
MTIETKTITKLAFDAYVGAYELLQLCSKEGGRIVCTGDLTEMQIAEARVDRRMYVDSDGFGYVLLPWSLRCRRDPPSPGQLIRDLDLVPRPPEGDGRLRF